MQSLFLGSFLRAESFDHLNSEERFDRAAIASRAIEEHHALLDSCVCLVECKRLAPGSNVDSTSHCSADQREQHSESTEVVPEGDDQCDRPDAVRADYGASDKEAATEGPTVDSTSSLEGEGSACEVPASPLFLVYSLAVEDQDRILSDELWRSMLAATTVDRQQPIDDRASASNSKVLFESENKDRIYPQISLEVLPEEPSSQQVTPTECNYLSPSQLNSASTYGHDSCEPSPAKSPAMRRASLRYLDSPLKSRQFRVKPVDPPFYEGWEYQREDSVERSAERTESTVVPREAEPTALQSQ
jgi:hypothetical protein